jgi:Mor family transcriptional regulator
MNKDKSSVFQKFLEERNRKIINLRKRGIPLKELSKKFNLSIRQISRIVSSK